MVQVHSARLHHNHCDLSLVVRAMTRQGTATVQRLLWRVDGDARTDAQQIRARIYARAEAGDGKLLNLPTSFANLLEAIISCFAKFLRMATSFGKLLEMLNC
jgi:hypothetical protein